MKYRPTKATILRTIVYIIALLNMALTVSGNNPIPYPTEDIESAFTILFDIVAGLIGFWKNNSYTVEAIAADAIMRTAKQVKGDGDFATAIELTNGGETDEQ